MADIFYNRFIANLFNKLVNLDTDDVKCALLNNTYSPNKTHNVWADVSAVEISGTGYTTGGISLTNTVVVQDDVGNLAKFDADDADWTNSTITARYAIIYDNTLAGKDLIYLIDFGSDKSSTGALFRVQFNVSGIFTGSQP